MPFIIPASSGYIFNISGNRHSLNICFFSWGDAAAKIDAARGSWPWSVFSLPSLWVLVVVSHGCVEGYADPFLRIDLSTDVSGLRSD